MYPHVRKLGALCLVIGVTVVPLSAQWTRVERKTPVTSAGEPDRAAPPPKMADGRTPDLSGVWESEKMRCDEATARLGCIDAQQGVPLGLANIMVGPNELLSMQPWADALVKRRKADAGKDDPTARCLPMPPPRQWAAFFLLKIIQTPETVSVLDEYMLEFRQVFTDGRSLPVNPEPMFKGYSIGKWDGDTLVVETIGFKDDTWLDGWGHPLTAQARTIERIRRPDFGTLEVEITVNDSKAYTKPWSVTRKLSLLPNAELLEYVCNENEKSLQHMVGADAAR